MIDHTETIVAFQNYTKEYNEALTDIDRKILHTFRVAKISELIAEGLDMSRDDIDLAWFIGILHDTGRFEQERRYGTFVDSLSVDHAELGADILFNDGLIDIYKTDDLPEGWRDLCEKAVRLHNKLELPSDLDPRTFLFCRIIRDADKTDIFRVHATTPLEVLVSNWRDSFTDEPTASDEIMKCVYEHRCIPRKLVKSVFENTLTYCCMAFDLDLEITRSIVKDQGFLRMMLEGETGPIASGKPEGWNQEQIETLKIVREEIEKAWGMTL